MKEITILIPLYNTIVTRIMETKIIIVINENEKWIHGNWIIYEYQTCDARKCRQMNIAVYHECNGNIYLYS